MNDQTLEERLGRSLDRQAAGLHGAPFGIDDVRGRARQVRRRRRAAAAGLVGAAVLAVAVPVGLGLGAGAGERTQGIDPAQGPTPAPAPAGAAVLHDGVVTLADGRTVEVDVPDDVTMFGVLADGRIVAPANDTGTIRVFAPDGTRLADHPAASTAITMGEGDRTVAWTDPDLGVQVLEAGADEPVAFPRIPMKEDFEGSIDAVLGSGCAAGGCRVLGGDGATTAYEITLDGASRLRTPEPFRVKDVSPDGTRWAVDHADYRDPQFGCSGVYDVAADAVVARTCETADLRFAPDGQHLLGQLGDNNAYQGVDVVDARLEAVLRHEPTGGAVVSRAAWSDAGHLLVSSVALDGDVWTLSRVAIDGSTTEVLDGPAAGGPPELETAYLFSE